MSNVINTVEAVNESTVVALARMCDGGVVISHDLYQSLGDDEAADLALRLAKRGLCIESTDRGCEIQLVPSDMVTIEEMPDHHRGSHRAARNWGVYPHNGATRRRVSRDEAEEIVESDADNYASIVGE